MQTLRRLLPARFGVPVLTPRRFRQAFLAAMLVLVVVTGVRHVVKAATPSRLGTQTRTAFLRWREPVNDLAAGVNVYDGSKYVYPYPNPPVMALALWPLQQLPPLAGVSLWFVLKAAMAAMGFVWVLRLCLPVVRSLRDRTRRDRCGEHFLPARSLNESHKSTSGHGVTGPQEAVPLPDWAVALAVLLSLHPILGDLSHGNVNIFVAFLVFASLELFRRRRDFPAGVVMALAIACKVTPGIFLPYFVWKRAWRAVAGCALGLALWLVVVPGFAVGWDHNANLLRSWYDGMVRPFLVDGKVTSERANQSIPGVAHRLFTAGPSNGVSDGDDQSYVPEFHTAVDLGPEAARWIVRGFQAAFVLAVVVLCRSRERQGPRFAAECGLIVLGMLLFSERSWKHHGVVLMLPIAVCVASLAAGELSTARRLWMIGGLVAVAVLTLGPSLLGDTGQDLALIYGSYTVAFLLLAGMMIVNLLPSSRISASS